MPARDKIHESVIRALKKRGWQVEHDPFAISISGRMLFIDLFVRHIETQRIMLVEIKTFDDPSSITALAGALGKLLIYREVLDYLGRSDIPLMLAIPDWVHTDVFSLDWVKSVTQRNHIGIIGVDLEVEEVSVWD